MLYRVGNRRFSIIVVLLLTNLLSIITSIHGQRLISTSSPHYKFQNDPIKVCFNGAPSWNWKILLVKKTKPLNSNSVGLKWLRVCGTKKCKGKVLDCVTFDANVIKTPGEFKAFLTTKAIKQRRAGPVYFTVSMEGPVILTEPPTLTPTDPPTLTPSDPPTLIPTDLPTLIPTDLPSNSPSA